MAVVTKYGTAARDPASLTGQDAIHAGGRVRDMTSQVAVANGDSANSVLRFGQIPSDAIIKFDSNVDCTAVTGAAMHLGFENAPQALLSGQTIAAAAVLPLSAGAVTSANRIKRAWELAGLASNPGGMLWVIGTLSAGATAGGSVTLNLRFVTN